MMNATAPDNQRHRSAVLLCLFIVLGVCTLAYAPSMSAPFILDDITSITDNPNIRQLWPPWHALSTPQQTTVAGRPVVSLSLALNYAVGGLNPRGYHVFNLIVHLASSLLVFGIVRRTLHGPLLGNRYQGPAAWIALAVTAIWTLHPLQTETVIYTIQRTELLMGLFYLLTVYCAVRGFETSRPRLWYAAAVVACALGMASKEVMVSAPFVVLLYDRTFVSRSLRDALRKRAALYTGLALTWIVLGVLVASAPRSNSIGFDHGITALDYLRTQAGVILRYLQLAFCPYPLVISYDDWPIARSFGDVLLQGSVILILLSAACWASVRRSPVGFLGLCFFLILAPTSSFVPIVTEVVAERRMYLPLIVPVTICVLAGDRLIRSVARRTPAQRVRPAWPGVVALVAVGALLAHFTSQRARDYQSVVAIWQDTVAKRPRNAAARVNLGNALFSRGASRDAARQYEAALALEPTDAGTHYNLANVLVDQQRTAKALEHYAEALRLRPGYTDAHCNLAIALSKLGRVADEIEQYHAVLAIDPNHVGACNNLGRALARKGDFPQALRWYRRALQVDAESTAVRRNLANALLDLGRFDEAVAEYRQVLARDPDDAGTHCNLGIALAMQDKPAEAIAELRAALRLDPDQTGARRVLEDLLARQQRSDRD